MSSIHYEKYTIGKMIQLYCWKKHDQKRGELCEHCESLYRYSQLRLDKCPYGDAKGACAKCPTHCYNLEMREQIRVVMRYSAPRMLIYHPFDFLIHYTKDKFRKNKKPIRRY